MSASKKSGLITLQVRITKKMRKELRSVSSVRGDQTRFVREAIQEKLDGLVQEREKEIDESMSPSSAPTEGSSQ